MGDELWKQCRTGDGVAEECAEKLSRKWKEENKKILARQKEEGKEHKEEAAKGKKKKKKEGFLKRMGNKIKKGLKSVVTYIPHKVAFNIVKKKCAEKSTA